MIAEINKCIEVLKSGGIILYPTDTVWGIGCDATNEDAINKIFTLKKREDNKSMIVIVSSDAMLQKYAADVPSLAWDIIDLAHKPTTIIYPKAINLAKNIIAEDKSIGIRLVKQGFVNQLIHKYNKPIVSTSANISGEPTPKNFSEVKTIIKNGVDFSVNPSFDCGTHQPSSIIKIGLKSEVQVLRF